MVISRHCRQWRNVTIWCPPAHFLPPPQIFLLSPKKKKKKKKKKKVATFFSVFLVGFLPPWSFLYPQIFFSRRPNAKLAEIWYIFLLCQNIFRFKNCKFGNMPPPSGAAPLHSRGSRGGRYATDCRVAIEIKKITRAINL